MRRMSRTPILMYHSVCDEAPFGFGRFVVPTKEFDKQMRYLKQSGYAAISVRDYVARSAAGRLDDRLVVLTFDDGFADFESAVLPRLAAFDFTATLYIVSGFVGKTSAWLSAGGDCLSLLGWPQISQAASLGVEIGAHTISHPKLDLISCAAAWHEIRSSRLCIEDHIGVKVQSFAYPFGFRDARTINMVEESGFDSACAVRYKTSSNLENVFDLPRHIVRGDMSLGEFARLVQGDPPRLRQSIDRARSNVGALWRRFHKRVSM